MYSIHAFYFNSYINFFTIFLGLFGACMGSFANVCIYRIPEHTLLKFPGKTFWESQKSRCRYCDTPIRPYFNIPIFGYLILRGKTACCDKPLAWQYPAVELFAALLTIYLWFHFQFAFLADPELSVWTVDFTELRYFLHAYIFSFLLIICSVIDIRLMIIPDVISIPMVILAPIWVWILPQFQWLDCALGILIGGGSLYLIGYLYYLVRKEVGMGMGDVKLLAGIGGWLGYQAILPTVMYASLAGSLFGILSMAVVKNGLKAKIPFGPFLSAAAVFHLLYGHHVIRWIYGH